MSNRPWSLTLALALAASCATSPDDRPATSAPSLTLVSGGGQSDTVMGRYASPLVVQLIAADGTRPPGVQIVFSAPIVPSSGPLVGPAPIAGFSTDSAWQHHPFLFALPSVLTVTTDNVGRAVVWMGASTIAGAGQVRIEAPTAGLRVEASVTARPTNAALFWLEPQDTAITVGASYALRAILLDRFRNAIPTVPALAIAPTGASLQGTTVTGTAPTRAEIRASASGFSATAAVSVVPPGTLFASRSQQFSGQNSALVSLRTDGSGVRVLFAETGFDARNPRVNPARDRFVFGSGLRDSYLLVADSLGRVQRFLQGPSAGREETFPVYSTDGRFVYFTADGALWRADADGTNARQLAAPGVGGISYSQAAPSPDGRTLAFAASGPAGAFIWFLNLQNGAVTETLVRGSYPEYSPDGTRIVFRTGQSVGEMRPDGTGVRTLNAPSSLFDFGSALTWSPDGQWIATGGLDGLILVSTIDGRVIPIPGMQRLVHPTWR